MSKPLIIFDLNRTLYDPERQALVDGALEILRVCQARGYILALVSRNEPGRDDILKHFGLHDFFTHIQFVDHKSDDIFLNLLALTGAEASNSFVIGDVVSQEIAVGNRCGLQTIWFRAGKFQNWQPSSPEEYPDYTVSSLSEISQYLPVSDQDMT